MEVMDIVNRAAMDSGVAPSFNADEVPEDIQARGADLLRNEIIPQLNCDRSIDITEVLCRFSPDERGNIDLRTTPLNYDRHVYGTVPYPADYLRKLDEWRPTSGAPIVMTPLNLLRILGDLGLIVYRNMGFSKTDAWPTDQFGNYRNIAIWSEDCQLILVDADQTTWFHTQPEVDDRYNLPFPPMRVNEVYRASDGATVNYVHLGEFVSAEFRYSQLIHTVEDLDDRLRVKFPPNYGREPALLIVPVPIRVINSFEEPNPWQGRIIAPDKFRSFLVNKLGYRLAVEYGVSTAESMRVLANEAYQSLIKNLSKRQHPQDIHRKIHNYLERGRGWRAGELGYGGGVNG